MADWSAEARAAIAAVHLSLPENVTLAERQKAVDAAYPFGERTMWPYKAWLNVRRIYLGRFGHHPLRKSAVAAESPLERQKRIGDAMQRDMFTPALTAEIARLTTHPTKETR